MTSYAQNSEDKIVVDYFKDRMGIFLDIGSNDGKSLSNTFALALKGWRGLCVEPSATAFHRLEENHFHHKFVHCFNCAVSDYNAEEVKFFESGSHLNDGDIALLSSLSQDEIQRWQGTTSFYERKVNVIDVPTLLRLSPFSKFAFISLDAEGEDVKILCQMNLEEMGCELICVEWNSKPEILKEIKDHCAKYGLTKELLRNAENIILSKP